MISDEVQMYFDWKWALKYIEGKCALWLLFSVRSDSKHWQPIDYVTGLARSPLLSLEHMTIVSNDEISSYLPVLPSFRKS